MRAPPCKVKGGADYKSVMSSAANFVPAKVVRAVSWQ
jgi:hypothetical protein